MNINLIYNLLILIFFLFTIIYSRIKIRRVTIKVKDISSNFRLALDAGGMSAWVYDYDRKLFTILHGPTLNYGTMTDEQFNDFSHPDDKHIIWDAMNLLLIGKQSQITTSFRLKVNNQWRWYSCAMMLSSKGHSEKVQVLGTRRDITEEVEIKDELERINSELIIRNEIIKRNEHNLRNILDQIPVAVFIKDPFDQSYVYKNQAAHLFFGNESTVCIEDILVPEDAMSQERIDKRIIETGEDFTSAEEINFKDGRRIETMLKKTTIDYFGELKILVALVDISEQMESYRLRKILDATLPALKAYAWVLDTRTMTFTSSKDSNVYKRIKESNNNDLKHSFEKLYHQDKDRLKAEFEDFLSSENDENSYVYKFDINNDGNYEWWETRMLKDLVSDNNGKYYKIYGITYNVDAQKKVEIALQNSEKRLKGLVRQNQIVLYNSNSLLVYLNEDYDVEWSNSDIIMDGKMSNLYKQSTKCYSALGHHKPCSDCPVAESIRTRAVSSMDLSYNNCMFLSTAIPVISDEDIIEGIVLKIDDITEQRSLVLNLQQAKHKAEESDKLKSAFLANMSHEIRTPLNAIIGFSELMRYAENDDEREEYMDIITFNNDMLLHLINDILDLSKIESGIMDIKNEIFDAVNEFKKEFTTVINKNINPNIKFISESSLENCYVNLDRNRLMQVGTNFLTNAIKYTPSGTITMGLDYVDGGLKIFVRDTGIGIDKDKQSRLFQRFEKLDSFAQGTGLGLSICRAITDAIGGKIGYESEKNIGSLFWAWFPTEKVDMIE